MKGFADLADLPEAERVKIIAETAASGKIVGVVLERDEKKIKRYIEKITRDPNVVLVERGKGLTKDTVLLRFGPNPNTQS